MRLIKWILLLAFFAGGWYLWTNGTTAIPGGNLVSRAQQAVSFRHQVESRLNAKNNVPLAEVPLEFQQAIIAVEDNRFYHHIGIDIEALFRAILVNVQTGELREGGSTITQQLVKNLFLSQDRTWERKLFEVPLAFVMEYTYPKEKILEMYINTIYFGSGAYGINAASVNYFGKPPKALNLAEATLIAGLPAAPSLYSPFVDLNLAKQRQAIVLAAMVKHSYIGPQQAEAAKAAPLRLVK